MDIHSINGHWSKYDRVDLSLEIDQWYFECQPLISRSMDFGTSTSNYCCFECIFILSIDSQESRGTPVIKCGSWFSIVKNNITVTVYTQIFSFGILPRLKTKKSQEPFDYSSFKISFEELVALVEPRYF